MAESKISAPNLFNIQITNVSIDVGSVSASSGKQGTYNIPAQSGWSPIATVGFESDMWECCVTKAIVVESSRNLYWAVRNTATAAKSPTLNIRILWRNA